LRSGIGDGAERVAQRALVARLISHVRWAGALLGLVEAFLTSSPRPVHVWSGVFIGAALVVAYNVPAALAPRLRSRFLEPVILIGLAGDFAVVTAWMMLTADDPFSTAYAAYGLVAVEAAVLYQWRGSIAFIAAFGSACAAFYWLRWAAFGFPPLLDSVLYRVGIVVTGAAFIGAITTGAESRRQRHEALLDAISDLGEGLVITESGRIIYSNEAYRELTGYTDEELRALSSLTELAPGEAQGELRRSFDMRLGGGTAATQSETQLITKDGRLRDVETAIRALPAEGSRRLIAVVRDITDRKRAKGLLEESERKAEAAAHIDSLTGIANRRAWDEHLVAAMTRARTVKMQVTVALLDLDDFKAYNDDWGRARGDDLLQAFSDRWSEPLRGVDFLARYDGDAFAVLLPGLGIDEARLVIERLRASTAAMQSFSVGLAGWDGLESAEALMARADAALYNSKSVGPGRVTVLATSHERVQSWSYLIPRMIAARDIDAIYQPIMRLDDLEVVGYEALARPAGFGLRSSVEDLFDAARRLGFTRDLDWLCRRAAVSSAGPLPGHALLFINVSIHALLDPMHDVDQMLLLMRWARRDPRQVVFEISERDVITDLDRLRGVVETYREVGFRFALDDVGEGHSTIEVLTSANPEFIKIARSLSVSLDSAGPRSAVQALATFGASSGATLIAEGLETDQQIRLIRDLGVPLGQGYALGTPGTAAQMAERPSVMMPARLAAGAG